MDEDPQGRKVTSHFLKFSLREPHDSGVAEGSCWFLHGIARVEYAGILLLAEVTDTLGARKWSTFQGEKVFLREIRLLLQIWIR